MSTFSGKTLGRAPGKSRLPLAGALAPGLLAAGVAVGTDDDGGHLAANELSRGERAE
ncbi:hypothetical protein [Streptomyces sp. IBSBF 3136]|uniref:hypothetical protein n=1 Tax=Streptomyces sp. IBSBF 3136 TaxID=2903524 RepID=UPI002FDBA6E7